MAQGKYTEKPDRFDVRLSPEEKQLLQDCATALKIKKSEAVRLAIGHLHKEIFPNRYK